MTRQRAARVTRGPELEAPALLPVTHPAATVGRDVDWRAARRLYEVDGLPFSRIAERVGATWGAVEREAKRGRWSQVDRDDDEPSAAEIAFADYEDRARECRRGL